MYKASPLFSATPPALIDNLFTVLERVAVPFLFKTLPPLATMRPPAPLLITFNEEPSF